MKQIFKNPKVKISNYDGKKIPYPNDTFDRIIISHCLEHIPFPEKFLFEMMRNSNQVEFYLYHCQQILVFFWRLGRKFKNFFQLKKTYQITKEEFDYMNATEHINSIFNLKSIIKFHYKNQIKEFYLPFRSSCRP